MLWYLVAHLVCTLEVKVGSVKPVAQSSVITKQKLNKIAVYTSFLRDCVQIVLV